MHKRHEMLDLVIVDGKARGIIARDLVTGEIEDIQHTQWLLAGGYGNVFFCLPMRWVLTTAAWKIHKKGVFANPCYTQIHPLVSQYLEITKLN
jgi:succinate dehydrogenase / fumarate reductase flavoprotein subunit